MKRSKSIRQYLALSWVIALSLAVLGSLALLLAFSYQDYSAYKRSELKRLEEVGKTVGRRVAAELLLKEHGRLEAVIEGLKSDLELTQIKVTTDTPSVFDGGLITVTSSIPDVLPQSSVMIAIPSKPLISFVGYRGIIFALIPMFGLVLTGFFLQQRMIRRKIVEPIRTLADTSTGNLPACESWPEEIQTISAELAESFSAREQAVYGHLVRGIIHDLRTYLNSISTALQLSEEARAEQDKRIARLEKLVTACKRNLPKIQEIIDLSLDSSREITLRASNHDLAQTLASSIGNIAELAKAKNVAIVCEDPSTIVAPHDPIQIERAFTNILRNAIEATEESSQSRREVRIQISVDSTKRVVIRFEDSGPGLKDTQFAFRPLQTTKSHGHGLGLFVSRKLIQAHQGEIQAGRSSTLGGAAFTVTLPRKVRV